MKTWQIQALTTSGALLGYVSGWDSLRAELRGRRGGTWELRGPASGFTDIAPGVYVGVRRTDLPGYFLRGPVTRITRASDGNGRTVTISGVTDTGMLAHRITLPSPERAFTAQNTTEYWQESGPAGFLIQRLVCRNAGMGAQGPRQLWDSRVGTSARGNLGNGATGWSNTSDGGVTWSGQTATIPANSSMRLRTTDAINLSTTDFATLAANLTLSGSCNVAVTAYFNTTAAGAAPGQSGVVQELQLIHSAADIGSSVTLWAAEMFRTRNTGKSWCRLELGVQANAASRTATVNGGGGVWTSPLVGGTAQVSTRFANLAETVESLANQGGVYIGADSPNGLPRLTVTAGSDLSAVVKLSTAIGNLASHATMQAAPKGNVVLVAGSGEGTARVLRTDFDSASLNEWGLRVEGFRDSRDTSDNDTLDARGDEWLAENAATAGLRVEAQDIPGMEFGTDYSLGDLVTVVLDGVTTTERITAAMVELTAAGLSVKPIVGSAELGEEAPTIYPLVRDLRRRISELERRR